MSEDPPTISGTRGTDKIVATLNIAGGSPAERIGAARSTYPHGAATATVVRKGIIIRVSWVVSSSFPGTDANSTPEAIVRVMGSAKTMPTTTITPVTISRALMTRLPRRHAASRPRAWRVLVNVGTKAGHRTLGEITDEVGHSERHVEGVHRRGRGRPEDVGQDNLPRDAQQAARHGGDADEACRSSQARAHRVDRPVTQPHTAVLMSQRKSVRMRTF
jgi:hypothetical protein